jgi:hypothetical protein
MAGIHAATRSGGCLGPELTGPRSLRRSVKLSVTEAPNQSDARMPLRTPVVLLFLAAAPTMAVAGLLQGLDA